MDTSIDSGQPGSPGSGDHAAPVWAAIVQQAAGVPAVAMDEFLRIRLYSRRVDIDPTIKRVLSFLKPWLGGDQQVAEHLRTALGEALHNAVVHGNLAIAPRDPGQADWQEFENSISAREDDPEFVERCVTLEVRTRRDAVTICVEDLGAGFEADPAQTRPPDQADGESWGYGLALIHRCVDEVHWNEIGNKITMRKVLI